MSSFDPDQHSPHAEAREASFGEDLQLVKRALAGSTKARRALGERLECVPRFLRHRNVRLGAPLTSQELPDLAQDATAIVWRKLPDFEGRSRLDTWIYRICALELMNAIRDRIRRAPAPRGEAGASSPPLDQLEEAEPPPSWRFEELYQGLSQLPADEEAILRRKHYDERSFEQIGRELGLTPSGVKYRYYAALRHLRHLMGETQAG